MGSKYTKPIYVKKSTYRPGKKVKIIDPKQGIMSIEEYTKGMSLPFKNEIVLNSKGGAIDVGKGKDYIKDLIN